MARVLTRSVPLLDIKRTEFIGVSGELPLKSVKIFENAVFTEGAIKSVDYIDSYRLGNIPAGLPLEQYTRMEEISLNGSRFLLAYGADRAYIYRGGKWETLVDDEISAIVNTEINDRAVILLFSPGKTYVYDGIQVSEHLRSSIAVFDYAITHYGRIFAASKRRLYFSDESDPLNWNQSIDEGGYIGFDVNSGDITGLVSFNDYVYLFSEYSIYRITAFAEQETFLVKKIDFGVNRIIPDTVAAAGGLIFYLSDEGVTAFDGYNTRSLGSGAIYSAELSGLISACGAGDKYYLAAGSKIYIYDAVKNTLSINPFAYDTAVSSIPQSDSALVYTGHSIFADNGNELLIFKSEYSGSRRRRIRIETHFFDFGYVNEYKTLRTITLKEGLIGTFTIECDGGKRIVKDIGGRGRLVINERARKFKIIMDIYQDLSGFMSPRVSYSVDML